MASIVVTFTDDAAASASYQHNLTGASLDRIVNAYREIYATVDEVPGSPTYGQLVPLTKAQARKEMVRSAVTGWKDAAKRQEQTNAAKQAAEQVPEIPITET